MSASAPAAKKVRVQGATPAKLELVTPEENARPTSVSIADTSEGKTRRIAIPPSKDGVRVVAISEIKKLCAAQNFLRLADTILLGDLWVQPIAVEPTTTMYAMVKFVAMLNAPKLQMFLLKTKLSLDDLLQMLYLNDCIFADFQGLARLDYGEWINEKTSAYVKVEGAENATNRSMLANFIVTQDSEFSFYPKFMKNCGMFFHKLSHHKYSDEDGKFGELENASMIECSAAPRGKFHYVLEARCFPLPEKWMDMYKTLVESASAEEEVPETQPMEDI